MYKENETQNETVKSLPKLSINEILRKHQERALFNFFKEIGIDTDKLLIPEDTMYQILSIDVSDAPEYVYVDLWPSTYNLDISGNSVDIDRSTMRVSIPFVTKIEMEAYKLQKYSENTLGEEY